MTLGAPHLLDIEITQVLRRYAMMRRTQAERRRKAAVDLADFPVQRYPHDFLLRRVWELRNNFTAYDAAYVALARCLTRHF